MTQPTGTKNKTYRRLIVRKHKVASSSVPVLVCQRARVPTLPPSMRRLEAIPKCLPSCFRNLACSTPPHSNILIRSAPARTLERERQGMGTWPPDDRPSYSYGIPKKRFGKWWGVPSRIHEFVASVRLGANLDGLLLGLQPRFLVGPFSYRRGDGGITGGASRSRPPPPPRRPRPHPNLQLPWRAAVACLFRGALIGRGGLLGQ